LRVLGVHASDTHFLELPDQGLTDLLRSNCRSSLELLRTTIADWSPTDLLIPSISDTHPDHNALGVMFRLLADELSRDGQVTSVWNFAVHGNSAAFRGRAAKLNGSESEMATKLSAICCHKTQLKLSRRRFLGYAARPECFSKLRSREATMGDGSVRVISRQPHSLQLKLNMSIKPVPVGRPSFLLLGHDLSGAVACMTVPLPLRLIFGSGEISVLIDRFSNAHVIFLKLDRCPIFFDEAGWLEIPAVMRPASKVVSSSNAPELSLAVR